MRSVRLQSLTLIRDFRIFRIILIQLQQEKEQKSIGKPVLFILHVFIFYIPRSALAIRQNIFPRTIQGPMGKRMIPKRSI